MEDQVDQSCFIPGFSVSFQKSFFYIINWFSPFTMLLSVWCVVSNAAVIIALYRSGNKFIRPGLSMLCSLSITDLLWGATVALVESGLRLKHLLISQVCEMYSEFSKIPFISPPVVLYICTIFNLTIVSIDRFLAVKHFAHWQVLGDKATGSCRLRHCLADFHYTGRCQRTDKFPVWSICN